MTKLAREPRQCVKWDSSIPRPRRNENRAMWLERIGARRWQCVVTPDADAMLIGATETEVVIINPGDKTRGYDLFILNRGDWDAVFASHKAATEERCGVRSKFDRILLEMLSARCN